MEFAAAISSIKAISEIAKAAVEARDDAKVKEAITAINQKLFDLSMASLELAERSSKLQSLNDKANAKIAELEAQILEKAKYELVRLGMNGHAYVLLDQATSQQTNPPTYYCQHCYDKGVKSILRYNPPGQWGSQHWECVESGQHAIY